MIYTAGAILGTTKMDGCSGTLMIRFPQQQTQQPVSQIPCSGWSGEYLPQQLQTHVRMTWDDLCSHARGLICSKGLICLFEASFAAGHRTQINSFTWWKTSVRRAKNISPDRYQNEVITDRGCEPAHKFNQWTLARREMRRGMLIVFKWKGASRYRAESSWSSWRKILSIDCILKTTAIDSQNITDVYVCVWLWVRRWGKHNYPLTLSSLIWTWAPVRDSDPWHITLTAGFSMSLIVC